MAPICVDALLHADDIAIIGKNSQELQKLIDLAQEYAAENTFKFNAAKCVWVGEQCEKGLRMDSTFLKGVESFEYLGITFDKKGINVKKQVSRMCSNARKSHFILKRIGFNGQGFLIDTNLRLY